MVPENQLPLYRFAFWAERCNNTTGTRSTYLFASLIVGAASMPPQAKWIPSKSKNRSRRIKYLMYIIANDEMRAEQADSLIGRKWATATVRIR
jgi:hypothetical protein